LLAQQFPGVIGFVGLHQNEPVDRRLGLAEPVVQRLIQPDA
jgi:hypothetical protein